MAVISIDYNDLISLLGEDMSRDEILEKIPLIGSDIDSVDGDTLNIEFFPDRPDMYSVEGVARSLRTFFGIESGLKKYDATASGITLVVDKSVENVRPYIVAGYVENVVVDDTLIKSLMEVQEKLHLTLGRKRKKLAIGIHDARDIRPPFIYKAVAPREIEFIPLGHFEEMNLEDILVRHEKGQEYAWILEGKDAYPVILDDEENVLSFPPIINGTTTLVTEKTRNIFIDMTGWDMGTLNAALNIISTMLAERGGTLKTVEVKFPDMTYNLPDLSPKRRTLEPAYVNRILGSQYSHDEIVGLLGKMGFDASPEGDVLAVQVPPYRNDIIHPVDLVEDIAIAAGYENIVGVLPRVQTIGEERPVEVLSMKLRSLMIGLGFLETKGLTLSSENSQFSNMGVEKPDLYTKVLNPITEDMTCLRVSCLPNILEVMRANKHRELPQSLFEIGDVVLEHRNRRRVSAASIHPKASYTEAKSVVQSLMGALGTEFTLTKTGRPYYIRGRAAEIMIDGKAAGSFGELHPQTITNFGLSDPIWAIEVDVGALL